MQEIPNTNNFTASCTENTMIEENINNKRCVKLNLS